MVTQYKEKVARLEVKVALLSDENENLVTRLLGVEKLCKLMLEEKDKLK
jgi:hypothetical protein